MSTRNPLTVQISHLIEAPPTPLAPVAALVDNYEINVQAAHGWAIIGHYKNNLLQTVTLQKTTTTNNHI